MPYTSQQVLLTPHRKSNGCEISELLDQNLKAYNIGYRYWIDKNLSIIGGYNPNMDLCRPFAEKFDESIFFGKDVQEAEAAETEEAEEKVENKEVKTKKAKTKKAKAKKGKAKKNKDAERLMATRDIFAFTCWFRLEKDSESPQFAIKQVDLFNQFKRYWGNLPFDESVIKSLCEFTSRDEASVWIDRRAAFCSLNKELKISETELEMLFSNSRFPLSVDDVDSSSYSRDWLSKVWGEASMKTPQSVYDYRKKLQSANWEEWLKLSSQELYPRMEQFLGGGKVSDKISSKGSPSKSVKYLRQIESGTDVKVIDLKKSLDKWMKDNEDNFKNPLHEQAWTQNMLRIFERETGFSYHIGARRILGECSQMLSTSWECIRSAHTKVYNALAEKISKRKETDKGLKSETYLKYVTVAQEFCDYMLATGEYEKYSLRPQQFGGIEKLIEDLAEGVDPTDAVKNACEEFRTNPNFLNWLVLEEEDKAKIVFQNSKSAEKGLKFVAKIQVAMAKLENLNMPRISFPTKSRPYWVKFGSGGNFGNVQFMPTPIDDHYRYDERYSNDKYGIGSKKADGHLIATRIKLSLFDDKKQLHEVEIPFDGKRSQRDFLFSIPDQPKVSMNHPIILSQEGLSGVVSPVIDPFAKNAFSIELCSKGIWNQSKQTRWYANISVSSENKVTSSRENLVGQRFLGIDMGTRIWASYGVLEVVNESHEGAIPIYDFNGDLVVYVIVVSHDKVKGINPDTKIDVLNDQTRLAVSTDYDLINEMLLRMEELTESVEVRPNTTLSTLVKILASKWRKNVYKTCPKDNGKGVSQAMYQMFLEIADLILPNESNRDLYGGYYGGLTEQRIELMEELRKCYNALLSRMSEKDSRYKSTENKKKELSDKIDAIKKERICLIGNQIIKLKVEFNCSHVVVENLDNMLSTLNQSKSYNKRLTRWCPQKTFRQLKQQLDKFGISMLKINPQNSSHWDWADKNNWKPRLHKISGSELKSTYWKRYLRDKLKMRSKGERGYAEAVEDWMKSYDASTIEELFSNIDDNSIVFVPRSAGHYYRSNYFDEPMLADEFASLGISSRGIMKLIFWSKNPRKKD